MNNNKGLPTFERARWDYQRKEAERFRATAKGWLDGFVTEQTRGSPLLLLVARKIEAVRRRFRSL